MSEDFNLERKLQAEERIAELLSGSPGYLADFYRYLNQKPYTPLTKCYYIWDVELFLHYIHDNSATYRMMPFNSMPLSAVTGASTDDLNGFRVYLCLDLKLSTASVLRRFSALSTFYNYLIFINVLVENPVSKFDLPKIEKKTMVKLTNQMAETLLEGILKNDKFLHSNDAVDRIMPINEKAFVRREPVVLRNYAICCLFLGAGLRVSELVGIDLKDIDYRARTIRVITRHGTDNYVVFGEEVEAALNAYRDGLPLPQELLDKLPPEDVQWCRDSVTDCAFTEKLEKTYPNREQQFYSDMIALTRALRRQGRDALKPVSGCQAFFISGRGSRMSVRMVEIMIKEMVRTYLPSYDDKKIFTPHNLRLTCASRLLLQTGDIALITKQLNEINTFNNEVLYKKLQEEQKRKKIGSIKITK